MKVNIRPLRAQGRVLNRDELKDRPPYTGNLQVSEGRDYALNRPIICARLVDMTTGVEADVLPGLADARILSVQDKKMRFSGFERIDDVDYAQTWAIEVIAC